MKDNMDKYLKTLLQNIQMLSMLTESMLAINRKNNPNDFFKASMRAAMLSEKIAMNYRNISEKSVQIKRYELMASTIANLGIKVEGDKGFVKITLPALITHKKAKNNDFLIEPLLYALNEFVIRENFTKFDDAVLWVRHIYDDNLGDKVIRDYDNFELSELLDAVALHLMIDDSGRYMSMYCSTVISDTCHTEIEVMSREHFIDKIACKIA